MKADKFIKEYAARLAFLAATLAVLLFIPACLVRSTPVRIFFVVLIVLLLLGGGLMLWLGNRKRKESVHYFLYDRRRQKTRAREELTEEAVQDALRFYLSPFTQDTLSLLTDIPKPLRVQLEAEPQFRPLIMYQILHELSRLASEDVVSVFLAADRRAIAYLCRTLSLAKDVSMADHIHHLKSNEDSEKERISSFFKNNASRFAARQLRYIERNFDEFYVAKARFSK